MPIVALKPNHRITPQWMYPPCGKIRLFLEASGPVDVYVISSPQLHLTSSIANAQKHGVLTWSSQIVIPNVEITLPPSWSYQMWNLVISNNSLTDVVAVYYQITMP